MKKLIALLICLNMVLSMSSCSGVGKKVLGVSALPESSQSAEPVSSEEEPEEVPAEESTTDSEAPDESAAADVTTEEQNGVTVTFETVEETITAEDGHELVRCKYQKPTVTMRDSAVQQTIQAALDMEVEEFLAYVEQMRGDAAADYDDRGEDFPQYYAELRFTVARADDVVLSLVEDDIGYSGGAHGWDARIGRNFDTRTGEVITFDQLGEGFRQRAEELVLEQANQMEAESIEKTEYGIFYENYEKLIPYVVADGTESLADLQRKVYPELYTGEDALEPSEGYLTPTYYLNSEGVVFISGEYAIQPYAAGIIEFTVPYGEFADVMEDAFVME